MLGEDDGEHPTDAVAAAEADAAGGRGAAWIFPEDVCAELFFVQTLSLHRSIDGCIASPS